jgi:hypothetical protein
LYATEASYLANSVVSDNASSMMETTSPTSHNASTSTEAELGDNQIKNLTMISETVI